MKGSDNVWPKLIVSEVTVPASPSAGQQKLYVDSADHKLKRVNSAGTVTIIEGGGGGSTAYPPGSADARPVSPNAKDDEFDGTSSVAWTATPTAAAVWNVNSDRADHLHLQAASAQASNVVGRYQAVPAAYPFTVTAKLVSHTARANYGSVAIFLAPAAPTSASVLASFGIANNSGSGGLALRRMNGTTFAGGGTYAESLTPTNFWPRSHMYLRMVVNSATSVDFYASSDGFAWVPGSLAFNPGFTPGVMGIMTSESGGGTIDAYFDFFRVT